jgi:hypothetical protein
MNACNALAVIAASMIQDCECRYASPGTVCGPLDEQIGARQNARLLLEFLKTRGDVLNRAVTEEHCSAPHDNLSRRERSLRHQHTPPLLIRHQLDVRGVVVNQRLEFSPPLWCAVRCSARRRQSQWAASRQQQCCASTAHASVPSTVARPPGAAYAA